MRLGPGTSTDTIFNTDYDDFCGTLIQAYSGDNTLCSRTFPLFGRSDGLQPGHVNYLGNATINCHGFNDLFVLGKVCLVPCINDKLQGCCWVPFTLAHLFSCCNQYGCCPKTPAPTPSPGASSVACTDLFPTCPTLKTQLDAVHGSCFTADMGELTNVTAYRGMHLADKCCASCQPGCAKCIAGGHTRAFCTTIHVCQATTCVLGKDCTACMTQTTQAACSSYGVDCSCPGQQSSRRRAQSSAAVQVQAGTHASTRLSTLLDCLAERKCVFSAYRNHAVLNFSSRVCTPSHDTGPRALKNKSSATRERRPMATCTEKIS